MRGWTLAAALVLVVFCAAGCSRITGREAERRAGGWGPPPAAEPVAVGDLEREAADLPEPQRAAVRAALGLIGTSRREVDCSGLVVRAYAAAGVALPRTVREQLGVGAPVAPPALRPGDLVFFSFAHHGADHVGLYAGRGQLVHVSQSAGRVQIVPLASPALAGAQVAARRLESAPSRLASPNT